MRFFQVSQNRNTGLETGVLRTIEFEVPEVPSEQTFTIDGASDAEMEKHSLSGRLRTLREPVSAEHPLQRVTVRVENATPFFEPEASRRRVRIASFASTHLLLGIDGGKLISAISPESEETELP